MTAPDIRGDVYGRGIGFPLRAGTLGLVQTAGPEKVRGVDPADPRHPVRGAGHAAPVRLQPQDASRSRRSTPPPRTSPGTTWRRGSTRWEPRIELVDVTVTGDNEAADPVDRRHATGCGRPQEVDHLRPPVLPGAAAMTVDPDRGRIRPPNLDDRTWADLVDRDAGADPALRPGLDRPQPQRPRDHADRAVRLAGRERHLPAQPGAGEELPRLPEPAGHHPRPGHSRAHAT